MFRHPITIIAILCSFLGISAQEREFLHIELNDYTLVDSLPLFVYEQELPADAPQHFEVQVLYPEYAPLTSRERNYLRLMKAKGRNDGSLHLQQRVSMNRKRRQLTVSLSPIVLHEGRWMRLFSCKLQLVPLSVADHRRAPQRQAPHSRWTKTSRLSSGKWAKIRVKDEGIYCLTASFLKQMGFEHINRIKVYGYGGRLQPEAFDFSFTTPVPDDLVEVPTIEGREGRLFWAEGTRSWHYNPTRQQWTHINNHYSTHSYYFVTEAQDNTEVETLPLLNPMEEVRSTVPYAVTIDEDKENWYEGGRRLFDPYNFSTGNAHSYTLELPDVQLEAGQAKIQVELSMGASTTTQSTQVQVKQGDRLLVHQSLPTYHSLIETARAQTSRFFDTASSERVTYDIVTTQGNDARLDYIRINYPRTLRLKGQPYSFSPRGIGRQSLRIADVTPTTQLWRLAQGNRPTQRLPLTSDGTGNAIFTTDTPEERFVVFDAARTYATPEYVGDVAPQNLHADEGIDYIIIVPESGKLVEQAERLAQLHRDREGMRVKVVRADQLYNEFSSGTPDANAYRRYLKMLYDRAETPEAAPRYLLLMGKSPWDARFITEHWRHKSPADYLLAYEADNSAYSIGTVHSYVTDDFFALLDDNEGRTPRLEKLDLALGRMVATTAEEAQRLVDKVEQYLQNQQVGAWKNKVVVLGDDGDANEHMEDADEVAKIIERTDRNLNIRKIYWDRFERQAGATGFTYPQITEQIHQAMKSGAVMFNYSGHGAPHQISHEKVLRMEDFRKAFSPNLALWVVASCEIYPFDSAEDNLAESSLYLPDGGSIAFMCATRAVYASQNAALNAAFSKHVVAQDAHGNRISMGEALRRAKNELVIDASDTSINKLKYVLFGDPALTLALPTSKIVVERINGLPLSSTPQQLSAGSVVRVEGYVATKGNAQEVDRDFNGTLEASLFDRIETIRCKDNDGSAKESDKTPFTYRERSRQVFEGNNTVKEGRFDFSLVIPRDISYSNDLARLSLYAVSHDKQRECSGECSQFYLNGTDPQAQADDTPPKVLLYLNSPDTPELSIVGPEATLVAHISDESGINTMSNSVGHELELVLDGRAAEAITLNDYFTYELGSYKQGTLTYPLRGLAIGPHELSLRVWDVNNNSTTARLRFIVGKEAQRATTVMVSNNPAVTHTTFIARWLEEAKGDTQLELQVYDLQQRLLWTHTATYAEGQTASIIPWNLHSTAGQLLPEGIYLYRILLTQAGKTTSTSSQKLIISRL